MKMRSVFPAAAVAALPLLPASAAVLWADWTRAAAGRANGVLTTPTGPVQVAFAGRAACTETVAGTRFLIDDARPPQPPDRATASDTVAAADPGARRLTFSPPVDNLMFAIVGRDGSGLRFDTDFEIVSSGQGGRGAGTFEKLVVGDGQYQLSGRSRQPRGVIRFAGSVAALTWRSIGAAQGYGFTVGTCGPATAPSAGRPGGLTAAPGQRA